MSRAPAMKQRMNPTTATPALMPPASGGSLGRSSSFCFSCFSFSLTMMFTWLITGSSNEHPGPKPGQRNREVELSKPALRRALCRGPRGRVFDLEVVHASRPGRGAGFNLGSPYCCCPGLSVRGSKARGPLDARVRTDTCTHGERIERGERHRSRENMCARVHRRDFRVGGLGGGVRSA